MTRIPLLALSLAVLATLPAAAQAPARKPDITRQLLGTWEGPYTSEAVPPGSLKLVVAQDEKQDWKVTLEIMSDEPPPAGDLHDFAVDGNAVSWVHRGGDGMSQHGDAGDRRAEGNGRVHAGRCGSGHCGVPAREEGLSRVT